MSKMTIAMGSFIAGVCFALLLSIGNHSSVLAQAPSPQVHMLDPGFTGFCWGSSGIPGALPVVPSELTRMSNVESSMPEQQLDGLDCSACTFRSPVLRYSGGAFRFTNVRFEGPVRLEFSGAAANTLVMLSLVQALGLSQPPAPPYTYRFYYALTEDIWSMPTGATHYWYRADSVWDRDQEGPTRVVFADPYSLAGQDAGSRCLPCPGSPISCRSLR